MSQPNHSFNDPLAIKNYAENAARRVPGLHDLQKMAALLVAERAPELANVLVVGAGGGMELTELAQTYPQWHFVGVDPSKPMLDLAEATLGPLAARVELHHGYTETAPIGPFDAATCLLTMHFLAIDDRRSTLKEIHRRLKPGAPLVMAHYSFPQAPGERQLWLSRSAAFAIASGVDPESAQSAATAIGSTLPLLSPEQDEAMLEETGFTGGRLFYAVSLSEVGWRTPERATLICTHWLVPRANDGEYLQPSSGRVATTAARPDGTDGRAAAWQAGRPLPYCVPSVSRGHRAPSLIQPVRP